MQDMTKETGDSLGRALDIARITMQFGQVRRVTMHENGEYESDTTHTVMLTLLGIEIAPLAGCDPGLVAQFAAVHDLPEVYAGDTNTARGLSPAELEEKAGREALAMERLRDELGDSPVLALLERYEAQEEPEARLVRYLDKVTPKLTHRLNRGRALAAMDLAAADVHEKHATQGAQLAKQYPEMAEVRRLFAAACELVEQAIRCGEMTVAEGRAPVC